MASNEELWKTGDSTSNTVNKKGGNEDTLDLSAPSPETDNEEEKIDLSKNDELDEDNWAIPLTNENNGIDIKTIGIIGTVTILLLTGTLFVLLNEPNIEIDVPLERYESSALYNVEGFINFESNLDIPIPIGFINNDIIINKLDVTFKGDLKAEIKAPSQQKMDGYGELRNVFNKSLDQNLYDIDGSIQEEGENPANLSNAQIRTFQYQYIDDTSLEIIRSDIQSNASYSDTFTGERWYWQSATDWVPRISETGLLPHGEAYIGKHLKVGDTGIISESGIQFNTIVSDGGKINNEQTVMIKVKTSYISESILGYQYQYQYNFDFYMSESSSLPLKFKMSLQSQASSPGNLKIYDIDIEYQGTINQLDSGYVDVPLIPYNANIQQKTGDFQDWVDGAPAFGNGSCGLKSNFTLQNGIQKGKNEISLFNSYINDQEEKSKSKSSSSSPPFLIEANYTENRNSANSSIWNFTIAHQNPQAENIKGWKLQYNETDIIGENITVNNPIIIMSDIPKPLTVCSAEEVMTDFDEISKWATDEQTNNIDYSEVKLLLGQNLISQQSLSSPTSVIDIQSLNVIDVVSDLSEGNLNLNDYSSNINVETAGSYAYFLDRNGGSDNLGYNYQELAGVDAKDGLVLFNLQSRNSV